MSKRPGDALEEADGSLKVARTEAVRSLLVFFGRVFGQRANDKEKDADGTPQVVPLPSALLPSP
jgi:hypothetical protein